MCGRDFPTTPLSHREFLLAYVINEWTKKEKKKKEAQSSDFRETRVWWRGDGNEAVI